MTFPCPRAWSRTRPRRSVDNYAARLRQAKVPDEEVTEKVKEAEAEARQEAEKRVRIFFLLDAIARQQKIFVTESDVEEALRAVAGQHQVTPDVVRKHYEENNLMGDLRLGILERKVRDFLRENAEITDS